MLNEQETLKISSFFFLLAITIQQDKTREDKTIKSDWKIVKTNILPIPLGGRDRLITMFLFNIENCCGKEKLIYVLKVRRNIVLLYIQIIWVTS